jgi:hypothetical protein
MHTRKWTNSLGALLAGLVISTPAYAAAYFSPLVGGNGGTAYSRNCGSTGVLVGLQAKWGSWIDQLTPVCQKISSSGTLGQVFTLSRIGGTGGSKVREARCPSGSVVVGLRALWGSYIDDVEIACATWNAASRTRSARISSQHELVGRLAILTPLTCPENHVAKGLTGKAGSYVDSLSLVCNSWNQ